MKAIKFLLVGVLFGVVMTKAEIISWYRIYEMFHFQSFHMYGIIGSAVVLGTGITALIKKTKFKDMYGSDIQFTPKKQTIARYLLGGIIFGLGWALTGACPGPMFTLIGNGFGVIAIVIFAALIGTFTYGVLKDKLPH